MHAHAAESQVSLRWHWPQVSDHLDFGKEDTDEEKTAALASILAVGEPCKVKVLEVTSDER